MWFRDFRVGFVLCFVVVAFNLHKILNITSAPVITNEIAHKFEEGVGGQDVNGQWREGIKLNVRPTPDVKRTSAAAKDLHKQLEKKQKKMQQAFSAVISRGGGGGGGVHKSPSVKMQQAFSAVITRGGGGVHKSPSVNMSEDNEMRSVNVPSGDEMRSVHEKPKEINLGQLGQQGQLGLFSLDKYLPNPFGGNSSLSFGPWSATGGWRAAIDLEICVDSKCSQAVDEIGPLIIKLSQPRALKHTMDERKIIEEMVR